MASKAQPRRRLAKRKYPKDIADVILRAFDYTTDGIVIGTLDGIVLFHNKAWLRIHALDEDIDMRGKVFRDYERPELLPILDAVSEELRKRGSYTYQFGTVRRDGVYHDVHIAANIIRECDPPVVVVILREVTDLVQMQGEIARRNVEFALLNEIHQVIAKARSHKTVMKQMLRLLGDYVGANSGIAYSVDRSGGEYVIFQSFGVPAAILRRIDHIPLSDPGFREIMHSRRTVVMEEDVHVQPPEGAEVRPEMGVNRVIGFMLRAGTRREYLVVFGLPEAGTVGSDIRRFFDTASKQFGFAIERLELLGALKNRERELEELAMRVIALGEEEKRQCSRMLHDEIGQALTALKLEFEMLEKGLRPLNACTRKSLESIRAQYRFIASSTRAVSKSLHPAMLEELGLIQTLKWYIDTFIHDETLEVEIEEAGFDEDPPGSVVLALYRVAQEALTNVVRHAQASKVIIKLTKGYPFVIMIVEDNGRGISRNKGKGQSKGLGLVSMRERVETMGGAFRIKSVPGKGTRIRVTIPVEANDG